MKKNYEKIKSNSRPLCQIGVLIFIILLFSNIDVISLLKKPTFSASIDFKDYLLYYAFSKGSGVLGLLIGFFVLKKIRVSNKEFMFNQGNCYKDYPYWWYWFCSKILGYSNCSLVLVPIYMQFKLVMNDTFANYYCGEYTKKDNDNITVRKINYSNIQLEDELNLIISDTYPLYENQLPDLTISKPIILISRDNSSDFNRYDSPNLVSKVVNETRKLPQNIKKINIFATTNPKNTMNIAKNAFKLGERGNLELITVFQQMSSDNYKRFEKKGIVIYKR